MENNWKTSVKEVLFIFRGALIAIIPWIEKAKIKWSDEDAYDDWDNISDALFNNIVCSTLSGEVASEYLIAQYNYHYDDYSECDFIQVISNLHNEKRLVFVSFQSLSRPFDSIKVAIIDYSDRTIGYLVLKQDNLDFSFVKKTNGLREVINEINVTL